MSDLVLAQYKDEAFKSDASLFPSYTRLTIPYRVICRTRYRKTAKKYRNQFLFEHSQLELEQPRALDGVRFHREFCDPQLSQEETAYVIKLTEKQKRRLTYILENPIY